MACYGRVLSTTHVLHKYLSVSPNPEDLRLGLYLRMGVFTEVIQFR